MLAGIYDVDPGNWLRILVDSASAEMLIPSAASECHPLILGTQHKNLHNAMLSARNTSRSILYSTVTSNE